MNLESIYKKFPDHAACVLHLEKTRWPNGPVCPYCGSPKSSPNTKEMRHYCLDCKVTYSVTVGTVFHDTKIDLQKWFVAISIMLSSRKGVSSRALARMINVTKDTAWRMQMQIRKALVQNSLLEGIIEADETYIGGKNKNRHKNNRTKGGQGRGGPDKTPVMGARQRGGDVVAQVTDNVSSRSINKFVSTVAAPGSTVCSDEWRGYWKLPKCFKHLTVYHGQGRYVIGEAHTNGIENFWSVLKRGIMGQYHHISRRYLNFYLNEFCFRYNNRNNSEVFSLVLQRSVLL